jgi:hypothetical protein
VALLDFLLQELLAWSGAAMQNDQANHTRNRLHHYGFLELVHSVRLEPWGRGPARCSGEIVVVHWVVVLVVEASASGSLGTVPGSSIASSRMEDVDHASAGNPYLGS